MDHLQELKQIIDNQKTVSTSKLDDIYKRLEKISRDQNKRINSQRNSLADLNKRTQRAENWKEKYGKLREKYNNAISNRMALESKIGRLKIENTRLNERLRRKEVVK